MLKPEAAYQRGTQELADTTMGWRFVNPALAAVHHPYSMGETGENVAERLGVSREDQDAFALASQRKAAAAVAEGRYRDQLVAIAIPRPKGDPIVVDADEQPRPDTTPEALARLRPVFREGGTLTAGNSSGINDGASAALLVEAERARALGLKPMARVVATAVAGVDPAVMGLGPIPATRKALARAGLAVADVDLVELNEAFASQSIACIRELGLDPDRVNVDGGAIALGHPLGASGGRLLTTLVHGLRRTGGRHGLATMCIGVGQGIATIVERIEG
jgi:acetyl-CoA acetyltransferase family protein